MKPVIHNFNVIFYGQSCFACLFLICIIFYIGSTPLSAQNDDSFSKTIGEVDEYLLTGEFSEALPLLLRLEKSGYRSSNISYKIGECYLNIPGYEKLSIPYLINALKDTALNFNNETSSNDHAPVKAYLVLGDAYRINGNLDEAKKNYEIFYQSSMMQAIRV